MNFKIKSINAQILTKNLTIYLVTEKIVTQTCILQIGSVVKFFQLN